MLIKLDQTAVVGEDYYLSPDKLIHGNPRQTVWAHYTNAAGNFSSGIWRSQPGKWHISYTEEEFCHMIEGLSIVTEAGGSPVTIQAGDSFVIPSGFVGTWEVVEETTKRFVIYEPNAIPADRQPARAGLFLYAKDFGRLADFYEALFGMARLHATDEMVVLQSEDVQLIIHQIPSHIASGITITTPPTPREDSALKFFFTASSISDARSLARKLGGDALDKTYLGRGFRACNAWDPEGNIFHMRENAT